MIVQSVEKVNGCLSVLIQSVGDRVTVWRFNWRYHGFDVA